MGIKERIDEDIKTAMKAREAGRARLSVLRLVKAAIRNQEIDRREDLTDEGVIRVLGREVKQRQEALVEYERAGRSEGARQLREEMEILAEYLPRALSDEEIKERLEAVIAKVGATSRRDMGKVMGPLMKALAGQADGNRVRQLVEERLGE